MQRNEICICPYCDHIQEELMDYKTTVACDGCNRPYEAYSDGRMEFSHLYECVGYVDYIPKAGRVCSGFGRPTLHTLIHDLRKYKMTRRTTQIMG